MQNNEKEERQGYRACYCQEDSAKDRLRQRRELVSEVLVDELYLIRISVHIIKNASPGIFRQKAVDKRTEGQAQEICYLQALGNAHKGELSLKSSRSDRSSNQRKEME